jgi:septum formation protein
MTRPVPSAAPALVLASASPRRKRLLIECGYEVEVLPAAVEESTAEWLSVRELVLLNASMKSAALWATRPRAVVLGVDTLVSLDGEALGKPRDLATAAATLARLAGRSHQVYSGVCAALPASGRTVQFVEETTVTFRPLSRSDIAEYLELIDPLDKAGAYAAQEHGDRIIASTQGSWTNVLGLPMERLELELAEHFAIRPTQQRT